MHDVSRGHFKRLNHGLMIPALILSSATSLGTTGLGTMEISSNTGYTINVPLIIFGIIGMVSTCLIGVHRIINAAELQREHDLYSDMFASMANEIDMQLILDESEVSKMFINKREFVK